MLHVHHKGYGIVDTFPRDVAETKAEQVMEYAKHTATRSAARRNRKAGGRTDDGLSRSTLP